MENALLNALDYNGLTPVVRSWAELNPEEHVLSADYTYRQIACPDNYGATDEDYKDKETKSQLQLVWMMAVLMFGDYGTSPRYGWIEDVDAFRGWVLRITKDENYE